MSLTHADLTANVVMLLAKRSVPVFLLTLVHLLVVDQNAQFRPTVQLVWPVLTRNVKIHAQVLVEVRLHAAFSIIVQFVRAHLVLQVIHSVPAILSHLLKKHEQLHVLLILVFLILVVPMLIAELLAQVPSVLADKATSVLLLIVGLNVLSTTIVH